MPENDDKPTPEQRVTRAVFALNNPAPSGSGHYRSGWGDALDAATDAVRDALAEPTEDTMARALIDHIKRTHNTTLTDSRGDRWHFYYNGAASFRIKPHGARDWTNVINLNYGLRPEDVPPEWRDGITSEWLDERAAEWITDRNDDIKNGNL